jgi:dolichol-phosphate mannosyltransferase
MISIIIPAYNEVNYIEPTVKSLMLVAQECALNDFEVIVIDDGSNDGTGIKVAELSDKYENVVSVTHETNQGLGAAIRSGLEVARAPQFMVMPADNDIHPELVKLLLSCGGQAEMILSVPFNKELRPLFRNIISMLYQFIYMSCYGVFVGYINGPGIWPTDLAQKINLRSRRFSIISELNVKLLRSGCTYTEVPGTFQAATKTRSTITLQNLAEVVCSFSLLFIEIHISQRKKYNEVPQRIPLFFKLKL